VQCFLARSVLLELVFVLHPINGFSEGSGNTREHRTRYPRPNCP
jgi:hypothetical protein